MRYDFKLGEHFITRYELEFSECIIPKDTLFEIVEILENDEYKVLFDKCIYNKEFKFYGCKDENGNIQICDFYEIEDFLKSSMVEY